MSSYRFHKPVGEVLRSVLPVVAVLSMGVLLITDIPGLTTATPKVVWVLSDGTSAQMHVHGRSERTSSRPSYHPRAHVWQHWLCEQSAR